MAAGTTARGMAPLKRRRTLAWLALAAGGLAPSLRLRAGGSAPPLMLALAYRPGIPLADYWVSEKLDGVRGYWDGQQLLTRGGERIQAPAWFTAGWPRTALDGELWAGRGRFTQAVSTVRQQSPEEAAWRGMRFMVFDLPGQAGSFDQRLEALQRLLAGLALPWVLPVEQFRVDGEPALKRLLQATVAAGGEGLMLHRGASAYRARRDDSLLKLKPYEDAEARVLAHVPGKGRYQGMLGALLVETPEGRQFRLGTGFSDAERRAPPEPGTWVTYRFRGTTPSGLPRFASFMRVQGDLRG